MKSLYRRARWVADWSTVALLFAALFACIQGFTWRQERLGYSNVIPDARFGYSPAEMQQFLSNLQADGRWVYGVTQLSLDLVYPFVYSLIFLALLVRLCPERLARRLLWLPLLTLVSDLAENVLTAILALSFTGGATPLTWYAAAFTVTKFVLFSASLLAIVMAGLWQFRNRRGLQRDSP